MRPNVRRAVLLSALAMTTMTFAGCAVSSRSVPVRPDLPPLPASLASACRPTYPPKGQDPRSVADGQAAAFTRCWAKHRDTVAFYDDLRGRLAGKDAR